MLVLNLIDIDNNINELWSVFLNLDVLQSVELLLHHAHYVLDSWHEVLQISLYLLLQGVLPALESLHEDGPAEDFAAEHLLDVLKILRLAALFKLVFVQIGLFFEVFYAFDDLSTHRGVDLPLMLDLRGAHIAGSHVSL